MSTMNISLTDSLRDFVEKQVSQGGYSTSSEYVRTLIRKEQEILAFKEMVMKGALSRPVTEEPCDQAYFEKLRNQVKNRSK